MTILRNILTNAENAPKAAAVIQLHQSREGNYQEKIYYTYENLLSDAQYWMERISDYTSPKAHVGIIMGNTPEWILSDMALLLSGRIETPVPLAFSGEQAEWLLHRCEVVLTDDIGAQRLAQWKRDGMTLSGKVIAVHCTPERDHLCLTKLISCCVSNDDIIKVIHTSGTTSKPKGVQIRRHGLDALVSALQIQVCAEDYQRYLNLVPLSLLIEQVTALYLPLTYGGAVLLPPREMLPLGSPGVSASQRLSVIHDARPSALTLTPALVEALAEKAHAHRGKSDLVAQLFGREEVPLLAAGGAPVSKDVLLELDRLGIPVYQGYGLSENSSVVSWNSRDANRIGTVGKPLAHVEVRISHEHELCVRSTSLFAGYSNEDPSSCAVDDEGWLHTGDLAVQDEEGYLSIIGRKKTIIITANGRNISPEWLESAYRTIPGVQDVIVYGDKQQFLSGIFVVDNMANAARIHQDIIEFARENLNEIEHIAEPILLPHHPEIMERLFTVTGRPRRNSVLEFLENYEGIKS